jgi:uncharacterized protein YxeA
MENIEIKDYQKVISTILLSIIVNIILIIIISLFMIKVNEKLDNIKSNVDYISTYVDFSEYDLNNSSDTTCSDEC